MHVYPPTKGRVMDYALRHPVYLQHVLQRGSFFVLAVDFNGKELYGRVVRRKLGGHPLPRDGGRVADSAPGSADSDYVQPVRVLEDVPVVVLDRVEGDDARPPPVRLSWSAQRGLSLLGRSKYVPRVDDRRFVYVAERCHCPPAWRRRIEGRRGPEQHGHGHKDVKKGVHHHRWSSCWCCVQIEFMSLRTCGATISQFREGWSWQPC
mmetsp:Transcript_32750/g.74242  ORF Transcript_32750/g.74242 Transcript_32750/m.74242 type:complete len:207 (+) Transcript_32750:218-838(+)